MKKRGFTLVEIMIVVAIIGILIAIAVPGFIKARERSRANACAENLSKIEGAKEQWALEEKAGAADSVTIATLVGATEGEGYLKRTPNCPSGGGYAENTVGTAPTCDALSTNKATIDHVLP